MSWNSSTKSNKTNKDSNIKQRTLAQQNSKNNSNSDSTTKNERKQAENISNKTEKPNMKENSYSDSGLKKEIDKEKPGSNFSSKNQQNQQNWNGNSNPRRDVEKGKERKQEEQNNISDQSFKKQIPLKQDLRSIANRGTDNSNIPIKIKQVSNKQKIVIISNNSLKKGNENDSLQFINVGKGNNILTKAELSKNANNDKNNKSPIVINLDNTSIRDFHTLAELRIYACITFVTSLSFKKENLNALITHLNSLKNTDIFIFFIISADKSRHRDILDLVEKTQMTVFQLNTISFEDQRLIYEINAQTLNNPIVLIDKEITESLTELTKKENCFLIRSINELKLNECPKMNKHFVKEDYNKYFKVSNEIIGFETSKVIDVDLGIDEYTIQVPKYDLALIKDKSKNLKLVIKLLIFGILTREKVKTSLTKKNSYEASLRISALNEIDSKMIHHRLQLSLDLSLFDSYDFTNQCTIEINDAFVICTYEFPPITKID